jgi:hypothetical protein
MSESSGITWSTSESIRAEADYNTRIKIAEEIQAVVERCMDREINNHFISGLELARGIVLNLTRDMSNETQLDSNTLF